MRLAILGCSGIPARYGGFETFAEELAGGLVARGHAVTVFCQGPGGGPSEHRGARLEYVPSRGSGGLHEILWDLRCLWRARGRFDVVYMLGYGAAAFLGLARSGRNEVWVNMDGLEWRRSKWGTVARAWLARMERVALRTADRVVFDSAAVRREVAGDGADERIRVIEYGAELDHEPDPRVLATLGLRPHGFFLLVARIEPENHVLEILRAHARSGIERELLVVGDIERAGRYGGECRRAAAQNARFLGALFDQRTLHALRSDAAAVLHGHSVGGTNPALLEAMAASAVVVAHDNPYTREVLGERGVYFRDEDGIVAALRSADSWSAEERALRGRANRERVEERYTWDRIASEYAAMLPTPLFRIPASAELERPVPAPLPRGGAAARVAVREENVS
jgi:glycosyltransferase involved in cell wall biosynthesis